MGTKRIHARRSYLSALAAARPLSTCGHVNTFYFEHVHDFICEIGRRYSANGLRWTEVAQVCSRDWGYASSANEMSRQSDIL